MIVSHRHRFIFIAVPNTGSTSVQEALNSTIDIKTSGLDVMEDDFSPPERRDLIIRNHTTGREIRDIIGDIRFNFCFVRNPWDRMLSSYMVMRREERVQKRFWDGRIDPHHIFFEAARKYRYGVYIDRMKGNLRGTSRYFKDESDKVIVDFIGRFENLQRDYDEVCRRIGIPSALLPLVNSTRKGDFRKQYDVKARNAISEICKEKISMFGYSFD